MPLQVPAWLFAKLNKKSNVTIPDWVFQDITKVAKELHSISDEEFNEDLNGIVADLLVISQKLSKLI